jgi:hypothetical protein
VRSWRWDLGFAGVYRVSADLGTMTLLVGDFLAPNGLAFSPDESVLYVNDSRRGHIRAFDVAANGTLARQTDRVFADLRGTEPGVPDGMKVDTAGNVYCGGAGGIYILDPKGKKLGRIVHGYPATTNVGFGGDDWKTLYFTSRAYLGARADAWYHGSSHRRQPGIVAVRPVMGVELPIPLEVNVPLISTERKDIADLRTDADDAGFERAARGWSGVLMAANAPR